RIGTVDPRIGDGQHNVALVSSHIHAVQLASHLVLQGDVGQLSLGSGGNDQVHIVVVLVSAVLRLHHNGEGNTLAGLDTGNLVITILLSVESHGAFGIGNGHRSILRSHHVQSEGAFIDLGALGHLYFESPFFGQSFVADVLCAFFSHNDGFQHAFGVLGNR